MNTDTIWQLVAVGYFLVGVLFASWFWRQGEVEDQCAQICERADDLSPRACHVWMFAFSIVLWPMFLAPSWNLIRKKRRWKEGA